MVLLQIFRISITGSSQPAYDYYTYHYRGLGGLNSGDGNFFNDNLYSARATKVDYQSSVYNTVKSGMSDYLIKFISEDHRYLRQLLGEILVRRLIRSLLSMIRVNN